MAQKKTTKKATAKRTTTKRPATKQSSTVKGSSNLKTKPKWMNWKVIVPLIVVVAGVGGYYYVKQSEASKYTFIRNARQMSGGQLVRKSNGATFRVARSNQEIATLASRQDLFNPYATRRVCALVKNTSSRSNNFSLLQRRGGASQHTRTLYRGNIVPGKVVQICGTNFWREGTGIIVRSNGSAPFEVHSIRGGR